MVKLDRIEHFVTIPEDVTATLSEDGVVTINGPKGTLTRTFVSTSCKLHEEGGENQVDDAGFAAAAPA